MNSQGWPEREILRIGTTVPGMVEGGGLVIDYVGKEGRSHRIVVVGQFEISDLVRDPMVRGQGELLILLLAARSGH